MQSPLRKVMPKTEKNKYVYKHVYFSFSGKLIPHSFWKYQNCGVFLGKKKQQQKNKKKIIKKNISGVLKTNDK